MATDTEVRQALDRWLVALNAKGDAAIHAAVSVAVAPGVWIERCGWGSQHDVLVEIIEGEAAVARWLGLTAAGVAFGADLDTLQAVGVYWQVRYHVTAPDDFVGGGLWTLALDGAGRLVYLLHQPDGLDTDGPAAEGTASPPRRPLAQASAA